ncbi:MAG: deoxynucleoside kinase [Anaerolineaceae bacterium]|jgi:deoxyadenosine/deoxycytidine kinase|nr:deoxynucleoside kinase [Anaerolineaceae bacterium]MDD4042399.1 deoxynucleoside kinase [Anaerolineaceae bacterium]
MSQLLQPNQRMIVLAGNIGSGKTSLTQLLSLSFGWTPSYESVDNNPYLADFYADMKTWAMHLQMYFLGNRANEIENLAKAGNSAVLDRSIYEDAHIFVRALHEMGNLSDREYQSYFKLYELVLRTLPKPTLLIRLQTPVETLVDRIQRRSRSIEGTIDPDYLRLLDSYYKQWDQEYTESPVLTIDSQKFDFVNNPEHFNEIVETIETCIANNTNMILSEPA